MCICQHGLWVRVGHGGACVLSLKGVQRDGPIAAHLPLDASIAAGAGHTLIVRALIVRRARAALRLLLQQHLQQVWCIACMCTYGMASCTCGWRAERHGTAMTWP